MKKFSDLIATILLWTAGFVILGILLFFLGYVLYKGLPMINWHFLTSAPSEVEAGGGVAPQLFNSFYILTLSLLFSVPVGVGAGIYMAEYSKPTRLTALLRLSTESLATVPSIVLGLFGMILFVNFLGWQYSIIGGSATLALLNLPLLVRVTEESIRAVPSSYREASLAVGATKWQTIYKIVIPSALPGLITGLTLTAGRALGESAILIYTAGMSVSRYIPDFDPFASGETLAVHLWFLKSNSVAPDADAVAAGVAALLIFVVLLFNLAIGIPSRIIQKRSGARGR